MILKIVKYPNKSLKTKSSDIKEIKDEFKNENWDYLDFIAERVLSK